MTAFRTLLDARWEQGCAVSVGLDATPDALPPEYRDDPGVHGVLRFHRDLIVATRDRAAAYKPQSAGFEAFGPEGFGALSDTIALAHELAPDVPVILDAKRGDIGNTNGFYARAAFDVLEADAITVSPYMGPETMAPFLDRADKGVIVLCRTSNPGAGRYQDLTVDGRPLFEVVAEDVATTWNRNGNCGLVVGATYPAELARVRALVDDLPILVPGIGAQGGDVVATVQAGITPSGAGLLLHVSRSLLGAWRDQPDSSAAEAAAAELARLEHVIAAAR